MHYWFTVSSIVSYDSPQWDTLWLIWLYCACIYRKSDMSGLKSFAVVRRKHTQLRRQLPLLILSSKLCFLIILLHKALQKISRIKIECYYNLCLTMVAVLLLMKIRRFVCSLQSYNWRRWNVLAGRWFVWFWWRISAQFQLNTQVTAISS